MQSGAWGCCPYSDVSTWQGFVREGGVCPDGNQCPDGSTCCQLQSGAWGCCPYSDVSTWSGVIQGGYGYVLMVQHAKMESGA